MLNVGLYIALNGIITDDRYTTSLPWILTTGFWNDVSIWIDSSTWID